MSATSAVSPSSSAKDRAIVDVQTVEADKLLKSRIAAEQQHSLTWYLALKKYKYALFWGLFFNLAVIMSGFDPSVISSVIGIDQFRKDFGYEYKGEYVVKASWLSAFNYGGSIGNLIGSVIVGYMIDAWGNKISMAICSVFITLTIFIQFFSKTPLVLFVGQLLSGVPIGAFPVITSVYTSEIAPLPLRGIFTAFVNLGYVIGQFIAQGVLKGTEARLDKWAYKIPFAVQWIWPVLIMAIIWFAPESPWFLVRKERTEQARASLRKLSPELTEEEIDNEISAMEQTIKYEEEVTKSVSFMECFKKTNLRRTVIASMVFAIQPLSGQVLIISYCVYFFTNAGLSSSDAFSMSLGLTAIGFVGTVLSWPLMNKFGRRDLYIYPMLIMTVLQFIIGFIDIPKNYGSSNAWAQSILMLLWTFVYDLSIGPLTFVYIAEVAPSKLRLKIIALSNIAVVIVIIVFTVAVPYMINTDEANLRGKTAFIFGAICFACYIWAYFELPETTDRTFEELDVMFELKVPARQFKSYDVKPHMDGYGESGEIEELL